MATRDQEVAMHTINMFQAMRYAGVCLKDFRACKTKADRAFLMLLVVANLEFSQMDFTEWDGE